MLRYRKKPVEVEARQFTRETADEVAEWCGSVGYDRYTFGEFVTKVLEIKTLEGTMEAVEGNWIIKGVEGEFYPCRDSIFRATYESADEPIRTPLHELVDLCREQGLALDLALYGSDDSTTSSCSDDTRSTYVGGARVTGHKGDPMDVIAEAVKARRLVTK